MKFWQYVNEHSMRGDCKCGRCIDGEDDPQQPNGHTANLIFFEVTEMATDEKADADTFTGLVEAEFPHWLNGEEHSYIEMGADIGDQGMAMMGMGLGSLLGVWTLLTPAGLGVSEEQALQLASMGLMSIKVMEDEDA